MQIETSFAAAADPSFVGKAHNMRTMAALVFPGFQTLDFFGPIEILGGFFDEIELTVVAQGLGPVVSRHGQLIEVDRTMAEGCEYVWLQDPDNDPFAYCVAE